jgi:hypothetical protein
MDKAAKIVVVIVVVAASGYFIFSKIAGWHEDKMDAAIEQQQMVHQQKTNELEQKITALEQELTVVKGQNVPEEKLAEVFGSDQESAGRAAEDENMADGVRELNKLAAIVGNEKELVKDIETDVVVTKKVPEVTGQPGMAELERQILSFFAYLDEQPYIQSYQFEGGSYLQYQIALKNLSSKLPIITGEMESLYNMVRNVAHFYRAMGKKRVFATRQVLQNESEIIESVMKTFYQWFTMESGGPAALEGRPSPKVMYEYAGYILNTLGGRSYLLRRSPKVRALTGFYCVLALDRANELELNTKGIDIRPYIKSSLMEVENQIGLIHQKEYITKLSELNMKYYSY